MITIRQAKLDRERLVALHPTATEALRRYATERDRLCPGHGARIPFSRVGTTVLARAGAAFRDITTRIGVHSEAVHPRVHDLRHRFAVRTLVGWQRSSVNGDQHIAALSTYLGHVTPRDTYW